MKVPKLQLFVVSHAKKMQLKIFLLLSVVYDDVNTSLNDLDTHYFFHIFFKPNCSSFINFRKALHDFQLVKDFGKKINGANYD